MDFRVGTKKVRISPQLAIGKGGEADVYDLGDGRALKIFKTDQHPDLAASPHEQNAARARLALQQQKLPAFPRSLPGCVIGPQELALDARGQIAGYAMQLISGAEPLLRFSEPTFRRSGATSAQAVQIFRRLRDALSQLHTAGVLIGDFNDLNILVRGTEPFLIDADSFQFGRFPCLAFTERFLDPRLAGAGAVLLSPTQPFDAASDWFSYAALLVQSLLLVGPWGGVHRPAVASQRVAQNRRALNRVSIFRDDVQLPKAALPRESLPDDLLHELSLTFERDERRPLPSPLLDGLSFHSCAGCGLSHTRIACPSCRPHAAAPMKQVAAAHGSVLARTLFESRGGIIASAVDAKGLRLVHHDGASYRREDGTHLLTSPPDPRLCFALLGDATLIAQGNKLALLRKDSLPYTLQTDLCEGQPVFATHGHRLVWSNAGQLFSTDASALTHPPLAFQLPPLLIGSVLPQGTRLWLGPSFGLGLTRAGEWTQAFAFAPERRGLDDSVRLPRAVLSGRILKTRCAFANGRAWLLFAIEQSATIVHRLLLLDARGSLLAQAEAGADDGSWLGQLPQICAAGDLLFAATDAGLLRLEARGSHIVETHRFPDAAPFLDSETQLFAAGDGLIAVGERCARSLSIH